MSATIMQPNDLPEHPTFPFTFGDYTLTGVLETSGTRSDNAPLLLKGYDKNNRPIVVKICRTTMAEERFLREMEATKAIDHPGVISVFETGRTVHPVGRISGGGRLYYVMPLIEGGSLSSFFKDPSKTMEERIRKVQLVCEVMASLHKDDIVHRDLKPSNVMLEHGKPKLIDFGLVRSQGDQTLTVAGGAAEGTPGYRAPELLNFAVQPHAQKALDVYALGVMLVIALTGEFPGGDADRRFAQTKVAAFLKTKLPQDRRFDELVTACLSADLKARPKDAVEMLAWLERCLRTAKTRRPTPPIAKKKPGISPFYAVALLGIILASLAWMWVLAPNQLDSSIEKPSHEQAKDEVKTTPKEKPPIPEPRPPEPIQYGQEFHVRVSPPGAEISIINPLNNKTLKNNTVPEDGLASYYDLPAGHKIRLSAVAPNHREASIPNLEIGIDGASRETPYRLTLERLRGQVHFTTRPGSRLVLWNEKEQERVDLGPAGDDGILRAPALLEGDWQWEMSLPDHETVRGEISQLTEGAEQRLEALPRPLPGTLHVLGHPAIEILHGEKTIGTVNQRIPLAAGSYSLTLQRPGFARTPWQITIPPNSTVSPPLPEMPIAAGNVLVEIVVPDHAKTFFNQTTRSFTIEGKAYSFSGLSHRLDALTEGDKPVTYRAEGFQVSGPGSVRIADQMTVPARFTLEPLPATLSFVEFPKGTEVRATGKDSPVNPTNMTVPSLAELVYHFTAPGYEAGDLRVAPLNPGENKTIKVTMKEATGPGQLWTSPATGMEFVWIEALKIWVGKYEVTNGEYRRFKADHTSKDYNGHTLDGDRQPVVYVNFDDAVAFARWMTERDLANGRLPKDLRYRLPTEAEFLAYAQVGRNWEYPWGNNWPPVSGKAGNYGVDGYNDGYAVTAPVEKSWMNPWRLYGVGGNVWEVTASDATNRAFGAWRGGSWYNNYPGILRSGYRNDYAGSTRNHGNGFRLVLSR